MNFQLVLGLHCELRTWKAGNVPLEQLWSLFHVLTFFAYVWVLDQRKFHKVLKCFSNFMEISSRVFTYRRQAIQFRVKINPDMEE